MTIPIPFELEDGEEAKPVDGFPGYYITNYERLYSCKRKKFIGRRNISSGLLQVALTTPKNEGLKRRNVCVRTLVRESFGDVKPLNNLRKQRLTKDTMNAFNRWYIDNINRLQYLSNNKVRKLYEDEKGISIHIDTIRINRDRWTVDDKNRLTKIT